MTAMGTHIRAPRRTIAIAIAIAAALLAVAGTAPANAQAATLSTTATHYPNYAAPGGTLPIKWTGTTDYWGTGCDWIGLYSAGASDHNYKSYEWACAAPSGTKDFPIPANLAPGNYELRMFKSGTYTRMATLSFTVGNYVASLKADSAYWPAAGGDYLTVSWTTFKPKSNDWVGLYKKGADAKSYVEWFYTKSTSRTGSKTYRLPAGLTPGQYELRLYSDNSYTLQTGGVFTFNVR